MSELKRKLFRQKSMKGSHSPHRFVGLGGIPPASLLIRAAPDRWHMLKYHIIDDLFNMEIAMAFISRVNGLIILTIRDVFSEK